MPRALPLAITLATVALGCLAGVSAAKVAFSLTPAKPYVDDAVTLKWTVGKPLKAGWHYEGTLVARTGDCAGFSTVWSHRNPAAGKGMSLRFSPYADDLRPGPEWCQGKASIMVYGQKDGTTALKDSRYIGTESFRFRAIP